MSGHFEAKKHAYRQTQDGIVVSFVVHPNDLDAAFAVAPLGTRYMIGFSEIGDNEKPVAQSVGSDNLKPKRVVEHPEDAGSSPARPKIPFKDLKLSNQAGIHCHDRMFIDFLTEKYTHLPEDFDPADVVREICCISSRSELDTNDIAAAKWWKLEEDFQAYLNDLRYAGSTR